MRYLLNQIDHALNKLEDGMDAVAKWAKRKACTHYWRPARRTRKKSLARHCANCGSTEELTPAMFFAYFGRIDG